MENAKLHNTIPSVVGTRTEIITIYLLLKSLRDSWRLFRAGEIPNPAATVGSSET